MAIFTDQNKGNAAFQKLGESLNNLAKNDLGTVVDGQVVNPVSNDPRIKAMLERQKQNGVIRTPWVMSTTEWLSAQPARALMWAANPSEISWQMPQRSVHAKNLFGTVLHVWPDSKRNTFFDELVLTLHLQSGNIMPVILDRSTTISGEPERSVVEARLGITRAEGGTGSTTGTWAPAGGMANFYDFMQLVDAPKLTKDSRSNLVTIQYSSNLFPKLTLVGMFDPSGIQFTDSAAEPNQVMGWTATFIVYDTYPRLSSNAPGGELSNSSLLSLWLDERINKASIPR